MKKISILGAIAGDTIGSVYEYEPTKDYNFPLFNDEMDITDDSIMTIAVADWLLRSDKQKGYNEDLLCERMRYWGRRYPEPMGDYGPRFHMWLNSDDQPAYKSWGNGSAMRVSATGFFFDKLADVEAVARTSANVTHNHPEGIKGAQSTAAAIWMARNGATKDEIRDYITRKYGYDLTKTCDEIRPEYLFEDSCQETVPQAMAAFFDSKDYEDAIRLTISLGGDADTMGAITGAIAAAYYKEMPDEIYDFVVQRIPDDLKEVVTKFEGLYQSTH